MWKDPHEENGFDMVTNESPVVCVFTTHSNACDHTKFIIFNIPWYGIWMNFKGPHNFMITTHGHNVEMALVQSILSLISYSQG